MTRLRFIFLIFLVLMILPIFRYYELSKDKDRFISYSTNQSTITEVNFLPRGKIVDRNNNQLALDIVRPTLLFNNQTQKEIVSNLADAESIPIFLSSNRRLWFENEIPINFLKKAREACNCKPIQEPRSRRYYPYGSIASTVIGFSGTDGGLEGVERVFEDQISKSQLSQSFVRNRLGEKTFGDLSSFDPSSNKNLKLTLDITLQYKLFDELKTAISSNDAKGGYALIMEANSGDILAMASYPTFNPNDSSRITKKNRLIDDFYNPGSLIKPFTLAGAIQIGLISKETVIDTNPGCITLSGIKKCEAGGKNYGKINVQEIIFNSSQVGISIISTKFTDQQLRENFKNFGFGEYLNMDWTTNYPGKILDAPKLYEIDKAALGYGYSMQANSLQITRAYSVFANKGFMIEPKIRFEKEIIRKKVLDEDIAIFILKALRGVIVEGTAQALKEEDVSIAGKTGTAEKYIEGEGRSKDGRYLSSFAAIFPYEDPKYIMVVTIDEPDPNNYFGGDVAAPVVAKISQFMKRLKFL